MTLTFGTDGVRGDARHELTAGAVETLGRAAAEVLEAERFAVGRDTRVSGPPLADALRRGVQRAGGSAVDLGVVPTPAVARWCDDEQVAGAVISASHNPWHDNGVKLFAPGGRKLSDEAQNDIERRLAEAGGLPVRADAEVGAEVAVASEAGDRARRRHLEAVIASLGGRSLKGLRIVVDAANGAAYRSGPECLRALGAEVETIHAEPDGYNINDGCGSLHPESLQGAVVSSGADAGLAFDGDADRVLAVDHTGALIDGDQILAVCAINRAQRGRLTGNAVVVTVMANLGLRQVHGRAPHQRGRDPRRRPLRARVRWRMRGLILGGEQSGHLDLPRPGHHRRRSADRGPVARRREALRQQSARHGRGGHDPACRRCWWACRMPPAATGPPTSTRPSAR